MQSKKLTIPSLEDFDLERVKAYLKVDHTFQDSEIYNALQAAYSSVESYLGRSVLPTQYETTFTKEDVTYGVFLPHVPLLEGEDYPITVFVSDENGVESELSTDNYRVQGTEQAQIIPIFDGFGSFVCKEKALVVRYYTGYNPMPALFRNAILQFTAILFEEPTAAIPQMLTVGLAPQRFNFL